MNKQTKKRNEEKCKKNVLENVRAIEKKTTNEMYRLRDELSPND